MSSPPLDGHVMKDVLDNAGPVVLTTCSPQQPRNLAATNISTTTVTLRWEKPDYDGVCPITAYILEMSESSTQQYTRVASLSELEHQVDNLQPGTSYMFRVAAQNEVGNSDSTYLQEAVTTNAESIEDLANRRYTALTSNTISDCLLNDFTQTHLSTMNDHAKRKLDKTLGSWILTNNNSIGQRGRDVINLVLVGKTGAGKSSTGNLILGKSLFREDCRTQSCTNTIEMGNCWIDNVNVNVIDTPGLFDTDQPIADTLREVSKVKQQFTDGIDALLFVYRMDNPRWTVEELECFNMIQNLFGKSAIDSSCFAVLTHADSYDGSFRLKKLLENEESSLVNFLNTTLQRRVIGVSNNERTIYGREVQRQNIIQLILARRGAPFFFDIRKEDKNWCKSQ